MPDHVVNIYPPSSPIETHGEYIIGIKKGVAMVRYPNQPRYRADAAREGYDILTVSEADSTLIWKNSIKLSLVIVDIQSLTNLNN